MGDSRSKDFLRQLRIDVDELGTSGGLPTGGDAGQVLAKKTNDNFDVEWVEQTGGPGGGGNSYFPSGW